MDLNRIFETIYFKISDERFRQSIGLIIKNDIRVENFFLVNILDFFECLKNDNNIKGYTVQYHVKGEDDRNHIDLILTDINSSKYYIEFKHLSISMSKTKRDLKFYTSNKTESKKVGIIKDAEKLIKIKKTGILPEMKNLICCAIITPKPKKYEMEQMKARLSEFSETKDWSINFPVPFEQQNEHVALFYLKRSFPI